MSTIYVAGPMRGYPLWNFPAFDAARDRLQSLGHTVISPADLDRAQGFDERSDKLGDFDLTAALRRDVNAVLDCDVVALLPGWRDSLGALAEFALARAAGIATCEYLGAGL